MQNQKLATVAFLALGAVALTLGGCATKDFVRTEVGAVDGRVQAQDTRLSEQERRLSEQETRLGEVDGTAREALERAQAAGKLAEGKFLYSVVLSDDAVKFPSDSADLSPEAETRLMTLVEKLKSDDRNVYVEIQGHTDATGSSEHNETLGAERAAAARRFMNQNGVALHRLATISYGEREPVAPNDTREGRAQNRRVVLVMLN